MVGLGREDWAAQDVRGVREGIPEPQGSGNRELPPLKPAGSCLLTHRGESIPLGASTKPGLGLPAIILPKMPLDPIRGHEVSESRSALLPVAVELRDPKDPVHPKAGSLMAWPSPRSVTLLLNLNYTDKAPGGSLKQFMDQMTSRWKGALFF